MVYNRLHGVGGWLGLLVVSLVLLGPFFSLLGILSDIVNAVRLNPSLIGTSVWREIQTIIWMAFVISLGFEFYAGWRLPVQRSPDCSILISCAGRFAG